jgi:hypothetical protein
MGTIERKQEIGYWREVELHGQELQEAEDVLKEEKQEMNFRREQEMGYRREVEVHGQEAEGKGRDARDEL